jgi:hypothetical protein
LAARGSSFFLKKIGLNITLYGTLGPKINTLLEVGCGDQC